MSISEGRYRDLFEGSRDAVYLTAREGQFIEVNQSALDLFGYKREEMVGMNVKKIYVNPDDRKHFQKEIEANGAVCNYEVNFCKKDGTQMECLLTATVRRDGDNSILGYQGIIRDVTESNRAKRELEESLSLIKATLESTADGVLVVDKEGKIVSSNKKFQEMWRIPDSLIAAGERKKLVDFVMDQLKFPNEFLAKADELYSKPEVVSLDILEFKDGRIFERYSQPQKIGESVIGRVWSFRDVTERKKQEEKIFFLAYHDTLTGLPNRRTFSDRLTQELAHSRRNKTMGAVMFMDLDNFKEINDTLGHDVGDLLLQKVAQNIKHCIREEDTASRLGGDEFTVLLARVTSDDDAKFVAQKIVEIFSEPILIANHELRVTMSIGVSLFPEHGDDPELLIKKADDAMYLVKQSGKNKFMISGN